MIKNTLQDRPKLSLRNSTQMSSQNRTSLNDPDPRVTPLQQDPSTPHQNTLKHKIDRRTQISHLMDVTPRNAFKIGCTPDRNIFSRKQ